MMAIKAIQLRRCPMFTYKGEPLKVVQSFKYLGINVPSTNRWNACYESRLQASWNSYYMLKNHCNQCGTRGWELRLMLVNALAVQVLLHGVELQGSTLSLSAWNEIETIQKMFLHRQLGVKSSTSYPIMLLETSGQPIEVLAMQRVTGISQKSRICLNIDCPNKLGTQMQRTRD